MVCSPHSRRCAASAHKPLGAQSEAFRVMRDRHFFRAARFASRRFLQRFLQRFAHPPPRRSTRSSNTSRRAAQAHRRRQKPLTAKRCVPWCQSLDDAALAHGLRLVQGRHEPRATRGARPHAAAAQRRYSQRKRGRRTKQTRTITRASGSFVTRASPWVAWVSIKTRRGSGRGIKKRRAACQKRVSLGFPGAGIRTLTHRGGAESLPL